MKVKILLMPLAIVIAIGLCVWLVYPVYSNGIDGVKEKMGQLKDEQGKLNKLKERSSNANSLSAQIEGLSADRNILFEFIPTVPKEEQIFDNLNFLASKSSLAVFGITTSQKAKSNSLENLDPALSDSLLVKMPEAENVETAVKMAGGYEGIKEFLVSLEKSSRHSDFSTLEIKKEEAKGEKTDSNVLWFNFDASFNALEEAKVSEGSINDPAFSENQLDTKTISEIKNKKNTNFFELKVDQKGKANLFAL